MRAFEGYVPTCERGYRCASASGQVQVDEGAGVHEPERSARIFVRDVGGPGVCELAGGYVDAADEERVRFGYYTVVVFGAS